MGLSQIQRRGQPPRQFSRPTEENAANEATEAGEQPSAGTHTDFQTMVLMNQRLLMDRMEALTVRQEEQWARQEEQLATMTARQQELKESLDALHQKFDAWSSFQLPRLLLAIS